MTEKESYFNSISHPISNIRGATIKPYLEYVKKAYMDDDILHRIRRRQYSREVNDWLSYPFINNENAYETKFEDDKLIANRDVCIKIYRDLIDAIYSSGYELDDINQFKEDFIYYMYILSDNSKQ